MNNGRVRVEKLIPGGQGLGGLEDGKKIFFWNALPGEVVTKWQVYKNKSHYVEAVATAVGDAAPSRVEPRDECYLATSPWQIMDYESELTWKAEILAEIWRQHKLEMASDALAGEDGEGRVAVRTDGREYEYRNKMEYALYYSHEDEQIHLAFHQRGSHRKIIVEHSSIERAEIWRRAEEIVAELNARKADARQYQALLLRANQDGEVAGGLLENYKPHPKFSGLCDMILGYKYTYSPNGFFQVNLPVYEMALVKIQEFIQTEKVLDLYAGVGTIGLSVARERQLTLVECDAAAGRELKENVKGTRARAVVAKSEEVLDFVEPEQTVILDPPRAGCDAKLIERLLEVEPQSVIYLSCNPATQARDVKMLSAKYDIKYVEAFNFFPHTPHIENLMILERKGGICH